MTMNSPPSQQEEEIHFEQEESVLLPFALSAHQDEKIPFDLGIGGALVFSDGGVASAAYTSCSDTIGNSTSTLLAADGKSFYSSQTLASSHVSEPTLPPALPPTHQESTPPIHNTRNHTCSPSIIHQDAPVDLSVSEASSHLPHSQVLVVDPGSSLDFSQLMQRADDTTRHSYLPPLVEESEEGDQPQHTSYTSQDGLGWHETLNTWGIVNPWGGGGQVITQPGGSSLLSSTKPSSSPSTSLMETMGATITLPDGIQACQLNENEMEVRLTLRENTIEDVLDVIGNPELLKLWCEPINAIVVTNASDGARGTLRHCPEQARGRMYDGEWIEATTNTLSSPASSSSHLQYFYTLANIFWSSIGFPSYGQITMFVERQRGQVKLTLGPFPDGHLASHTLLVRMEEDSSVVVLDKLEMKQHLNDSNEDSMCHCSFLEPLEHLFSINKNSGYLEQAVSSMRHLRQLLQDGGQEQVHGGVFASTAVMERSDSPVLEKTTPMTPLLG